MTVYIHVDLLGGLCNKSPSSAEDCPMSRRPGAAFGAGSASSRQGTSGVGTAGRITTRPIPALTATPR